RRRRGDPRLAAGPFDVGQGGKRFGHGKGHRVDAGPWECTATRRLLPVLAHAYTAVTAWGGGRTRRVPMGAESGLAIVAAAAMLLAAGCVALALRGRAARREAQRLRERERGLRMALWASGQRYWDFHVPTARLRYLVASRDG